MLPFCFVLRTMIARSALVVLHDFTSAERVLNVGRVLVKLQWKHGIQDTHNKLLHENFVV